MVEDIIEGDVHEEGGLFFKADHPHFFHTGENEFLPGSLGGSDGRLAIELAGPVLFLA